MKIKFEEKIVKNQKIVKRAIFVSSAPSIFQAHHPFWSQVLSVFSVSKLSLG